VKDGDDGAVPCCLKTPQPTNQLKHPSHLNPQNCPSPLNRLTLETNTYSNIQKQSPSIAQSLKTAVGVPHDRGRRREGRIWGDEGMAMRDNA